MKKHKSRKRTWTCHPCQRDRVAKQKASHWIRQRASSEKDVISMVNLTEPTLNELESRSRVQRATKGKESTSALSPCRVPIKQRIAVFVLGPSAAGKTFLTFAHLSRVLNANELLSKDTPHFVSVDGGLMRDTSSMWKYAKSLPITLAQAEKYVGLVGFKDLHSKYLKHDTRAFKNNLFQSLMEQGANMVIPSTGADYVSGMHTGSVGSMLRALHDANYAVIMTAVTASIRKCTSNGKSRQRKEGKMYSSKAWKWTSKNVAALFNYSRKIGFVHGTYFIFDNTDWEDTKVFIVPPGKSVDCEIADDSSEISRSEFSVI